MEVLRMGQGAVDVGQINAVTVERRERERMVLDIISRQRRMSPEKISKDLRMSFRAAESVAVVLIACGYKVSLPRTVEMITLAEFVDSFSLS